MMGIRCGAFPPPNAAATFPKKGDRVDGGRRTAADGGACGSFPSFLPKEVEKIRDPFARKLAKRIERLPVQMENSQSFILSSCVQPRLESETSPVVLLHCFDSSCLEWRCAYSLLEEAGLEAWAIDVLGWGFSSLERLPLCDAATKSYHLYEFWKSYIQRPITLVGPSLGAAMAINFAVNYPGTVEKLVLINPSVYAEGTGILSKLPKIIANAGVSLLKMVPLRLYAITLTFQGLPLTKSLDLMNIGRLHCHFPWWKDATVSFMLSGGYNVVSEIKQVKQRTLIIYSENDTIVNNRLAVKLCCELPDATLREVPGCGHLPHVERPGHVAKLISDFVHGKSF